MGFGGFQPSFCRNIHRNFYKMKGKTDQERMKNAGVPAVYLRGCKKASFLQPLYFSMKESILEENLRRSMQYMTGGNYVEILAHPAAIVMVLLAVLLTLYFVRKNMRHEKSILVEEQ